jgi:hypothetical protein
MTALSVCAVQLFFRSKSTFGSNSIEWLLKTNGTANEAMNFLLFIQKILRHTQITIDFDDTFGLFDDDACCRLHFEILFTPERFEESSHEHH